MGSPEIRVIGAGFGRTGTTSLKVALNQLGFGPCHHMNEVRPMQIVQMLTPLVNTEPTLGCPWNVLRASEKFQVGSFWIKAIQIASFVCVIAYQWPASACSGFILAG